LSATLSPTESGEESPEGVIGRLVNELRTKVTSLVNHLASNSLAYNQRVSPYNESWQPLYRVQS